MNNTVNSLCARGSVADLRTIPTAAGIGLRPLHHSWVIQHRPQVAWFEVQAEHFMKHGPLREDLELIALHYPLALHAVGLSLGSVCAPDAERLQQLRELVSRFEPGLVSDHLSWSAADGPHIPDLLPLPYTEDALHAVIRNVHRVQDVLKREILLENASRDGSNVDSALSEADFLAEVVLRTGCGVLLDINTLYVNAVTRCLDPVAELDDFFFALPAESFAQIHLTGHSRHQLGRGKALGMDDHESRISSEVWSLYRYATAVLGAIPTLIEWDTGVPGFEVLQEEAARAEDILSDSARSRSAVAVAGCC